MNQKNIKPGEQENITLNWKKIQSNVLVAAGAWSQVSLTTRSEDPLKPNVDIM